ncbi:MAG: response regulator, partial [Bacteroidota bacterium]
IYDASEHIFAQNVQANAAPIILEPSTVESPFAPNNTTKDYERKDVLIVEDNQELRSFIKQSLPTWYNTIEAPNGLIGLDKAQEVIPDLIICDVMMPEMDGYELCHKLKSDTLTSHIPIIMLTAKSNLDNKIMGFKQGADAYLTKPFYTEELLVRIEKLIELRQKLKEKFSQSDWVTNAIEVNNVSEIDKTFLKNIDHIILSNAADYNFGVEQLAKLVHMSRSQLFRKFKSLLGKTPNIYIRECRLHMAMDLLTKNNNQPPIDNLSDQVGFKDERYFITKFKELFSMNPNEVQMRKMED